MMSPLIVWAALAAANLPPSSIAVVERGVESEHAHALAELVRARGRVTWGDESITDRPEGARYTVEVTALSPEACALVVRDEGGVLASRSVAWQAVDLGLLEGWLVVRSTLERAMASPAAGEGETPDIPRPGEGAIEAAVSATVAVVDPTPTITSSAVDGVEAARAEVGPPPSAVEPSAAAPSPLGYDPTTRDRLVDTWGVVFASQLAGAPSTGLAVQARKSLAPRVNVGARVGLEWSSPIEGVSATRVPLTGLVGWVPWTDLPIELGAQVQLAPIIVSTTDDNGGIGLTASVGGYGRGSWMVGPINLFGELALALPLARHSYDSATETATDPALDFRINLGAEWRWP